MVLEFGLLDSGLFPATSAEGEGMNADLLEKLRLEEGTGVVPIGSVIAWIKTLAGVPALPSNFVECNGAAIADSDSPMFGQNVPNLNGNNNFLRGAAASGGTGGSLNHSHNQVIGAGTIGVGVNATNTRSNLPPYYEVVWVMRIK